MTELSTVAVATAFLGGLISIASPCAVSLIPGYLMFLTTTSDTGTSRLKPGLYFIAGFSTFFLVLGVNAVFLGQLFWHYKSELSLVAGGLIMLNGFWLMGIFQPRRQPLTCSQNRQPENSNHTSAFVLGLSFAFGRTPCTGPILGAILTYSASYPHSWGGELLLILYATGMALPFLVLALCYERLITADTRIVAMLQRLRWFAALILIGLGLAIATDNMVYLSAWLGQLFPALTTLG